MDGWSGNARYGPPAGYGRLHERARNRTAVQRRLFDTVELNAIERQYRPGGWTRFVESLL